MPDLSHDPVVILAARGAFALLFASAVWHKLRDRAAFAAVLAAYRVVPASLVPPAGVAIVAVELATATAWLAPGAVAVAARATTVLLATYAAAIGVNLARGRRAIDCGCGVGGAVQPIGEGLLVRNALLAVAAWLTAAAVVPGSPAGARVVDALVSDGSRPAVSGAARSGVLAAGTARLAASDVAPSGVLVPGAARSEAADAPSEVFVSGTAPSASSIAVRDASAAGTGGALTAGSPRALAWIDVLTVAGLLTVVVSVWTAAHGLAAAARVRAVDDRHALRHGADA